METSTTEERQQVSVDTVLDALEGMADQYLAYVDEEEDRVVYDHAFMVAGERCLEVLIAAGRIPAWMDYRTGGKMGC